MSKTIIFFGSGPVAAKSLDLLSHDFEIEAVITKPQPAHHKQLFPVIKLAQELKLQTLTAATSRELSNLFSAHKLKSEIGIIIDHGIIINHDVIKRFPRGIINSHFSLLPRWRGADPISFSILNGDPETGVSLMIIADRLDEGELIAQRSLPIDLTTTTPSLTQQLISLSHELLVETIPLYSEGKIHPYPQSNETPSYSHKLSKSDGIIDWNNQAVQIERQIRAYLGWPRSQTRLNDIEVTVTSAHVVPGSGKPGTIKIENQQLGVCCGQDLLIIDRLIPSGKREMAAGAFLQGYQIS